MPAQQLRPPSPRVAVSIVLWHSRQAQVRTCIEALAASRPALHQIRLLSNEDVDPPGTGWDTIERHGMDVVLERSPLNLGFAGGHNTTLAALFADPSCDAVLVLNPDVAVHPAAVETLATFADSRPSPALLGPLLELAVGDALTGEGTVDTAGIVWTRTGRHLDALQGVLLGQAPTRPVPVAGVSGACLLVTRVAYDLLVRETGEFFDGDFIAYREDAELGLRAEALGIECWLVPAATGRHGRGLRGTSRATSAHVNRLGVRNRFLIRFKYGRRRPGGLVGAQIRDVAVVAAVLLRERSSLPGLAEAWQLRSRMRAKGSRLRAAAARRRQR